GDGGLGAGGRTVALGVLAVLAALWLVNSFYRGQPDEAGVVLRFGRYDRTTGPGLHFALWPIETVERPKVAKENKLSFGDTNDESLMLAGDQNIVDIRFTVLWRIRDAGEFLFNVKDPRLLARRVAESAMREIVGRTPAEEIRTRGRVKAQEEVRDLIQKTLDRYRAGILVTSVQLEKADPPPQVIDAFEEVQRAEQDQDKFIREAERYSNRVLGEARGRASQIVEQAKAYRAKVVAEAKGEAQRFLQVLAEYRKAPEVTRRRLYLETLETIMGRASKVILDRQQSGNVLPFLPLDRLQRPPRATAAPPAAGAVGPVLKETRP
ncbi:MAG TPA: FtsH protease activity modulator HflK, partial [Bryobacterales bacterium]|nr:FtsH protease activity modulator HflK [Bryobacterales bacterium]